MSTGLLSAIFLILIGLSLSPVARAAEADSSNDGEESDSLVKERIERERAVQDNRSVLLAHKRNYVLPLAYSNDPNDDVISASISITWKWLSSSASRHRSPRRSLPTRMRCFSALP
jgi:hypothetical protein